MAKFVSKDKMSRKQQKKLNAEKRATWMISPVTKKIESKKVYNRKRISRTAYDDSREIFLRGCTA